MARRPSPRYWESRGSWTDAAGVGHRGGYYCQFNGKQVCLASGPDDAPHGPTYLAALGQFKSLMEMGNVERAGGTNSVRVILEAYMGHAEHRLGPGTVEKRKYLLGPFVRECGETRVAALTHFQVDRFLDRMRRPRRVGKRTFRWQESTVASWFEAAHAAFNWAVRTKLIPENPLRGMERPSARSGSRDCLVSPGLHEKLLAECRAASMRNLVLALENSGARPGELVAAEGRDWNDELGAVVYYGDDRRREDEFRHKAAGHKKDRVIRFTGPVLEMVRAAAAKGPREPLFPSTGGKKYRQKSVQSCFRALRGRLGVPRLTPKAYRHTLATNWLLAGKSIDVLAELLGNTPATIRKHYAHLCLRQDGIRAQLEDFMSPGGRSERPGPGVG